MAHLKIRVRAPGTSKRAASDDEHSQPDDTSGLISKARLPHAVRVIGWLVIAALVVGMILWLQGIDENLRRELVEQCRAAGRGDCTFQRRAKSVGPGTLSGFFAGDGIEGYSRHIPLFKQAAVAVGGMMLARRLFGRSLRRS